MFEMTWHQAVAYGQTMGWAMAALWITMPLSASGSILAVHAILVLETVLAALFAGINLSLIVLTLADIRRAGVLRGILSIRRARVAAVVFCMFILPIILYPFVGADRFIVIVCWLLAALTYIAVRLYEDVTSARAGAG